MMLMNIIERRFQKIRNMFNNGLDKDNDSYIYESPDGGKTIYQRRAGDYKNKELISMKPITKTRAKERLEYLNTELSHSDRWDGWSVKGMEEEKEWLESQLNDK